MNNLDSNDINLRTLILSDYAKLISDLNYNFAQVLQLPGFKGMRGNTGDDGVTIVGERGSKWYVAKIETFKTYYPILVNGDNITQTFVNNEILTDLEKFLAAIDADLLVDKDVLVLPNGQVLQFNPLTVSFDFSGLTFAGNNTLTPQEITNLVTEILGGTNVENIVFNQYSASAKNVSDISGGVNNSLNIESVVAPKVSSSVSGVPIANILFISALEAISNNKNILNILGNIRDYHNIIQTAQVTPQTGNFFIPKQYDVPNVVIMQNNERNGLMIGYKNSTSFKAFASIYKESENSLVIKSNYSNNAETYGEIRLSKASGTIICDVLTIPKDLVINGKLTTKNIKDFGTTFLIGETANLVDIIKKTKVASLQIDNLRSTSFLATDSNGNVIKSQYIVQNAIILPRPDKNISIPTINYLESLYYGKDDANNDFLKKTDNLFALTNKEVARINLGVYSKNELYTSTQTDSFYMRKAANLSDLTDKEQARVNLDVYSINQVYNQDEVYSKDEVDSDLLRRERNLADVTDAPTALQNIGGVNAMYSYPRSSTFTRTETFSNIGSQLLCYALVNGVGDAGLYAGKTIYEGVGIFPVSNANSTGVITQKGLIDIKFVRINTSASYISTDITFVPVEGPSIGADTRYGVYEINMKASSYIQTKNDYFVTANVYYGMENDREPVKSVRLGANIGGVWKQTELDFTIISTYKEFFVQVWFEIFIWKQNVS